MVLMAPGVVLMLVVRVEFYMPPYRKKAADVESGGAPFVELAPIKGLDGDVRDVVKGAYGDRPLNRQFVVIAPCETTVSPVEVAAVTSRHAESSFHGKVEGRRHQHSICGRSIGRAYVSISGLQHDESRLCIVQIKGPHFFELGQGFQVELNARAYSRLRRITAVLIVLSLHIHSKHRAQL